MEPMAKAFRLGLKRTDMFIKLFFINQMIVPGSVYWNLGVGREKEGVGSDDEGMNTLRVLGENIAWLLSKTKGAV